MCVCVTKCVTAEIYPMEVQISSITNLIFQMKFMRFVLGIKNILGLYVFESLRQETKKLFYKYELNFLSLTWSSPGDGRMNLDY